MSQADDDLSLSERLANSGISWFCLGTFKVTDLVEYKNVIGVFFGLVFNIIEICNINLQHITV